MNKHTEYAAYIKALNAALPYLTKPGECTGETHICLAIHAAAADKHISFLDEIVTRSMITSRLGTHRTLASFVASTVDGVTHEMLLGMLADNMQAHRIEWVNRMLAEFNEAVKTAPTDIELYDVETCEKTLRANGTVRYRNSLGDLHNDFGPAVTRAGGKFAYYWRGVVHRVGGPGTNRRYYLFGNRYDRKAYDAECKAKTLPDWEYYDAYQQARNVSYQVG